MCIRPMLEGTQTEQASALMLNSLQAKGNAAFSAKQFPEAIELFSQAIALAPSNHVLFSNRSACHVRMILLSSRLRVLWRISLPPAASNTNQPA